MSGMDYGSRAIGLILSGYLGSARTSVVPVRTLGSQSDEGTGSVRVGPGVRHPPVLPTGLPRRTTGPLWTHDVSHSPRRVCTFRGY